MSSQPDAIHVRHNSSALAVPEKMALVWMANRLPSWVNSDHLTILGLSAMALAGASYWLARWYPQVLCLVVAALVLNWLGDSLDGTLARVRNRQRPRFGYYVDHVIDMVGAALILGGLALSGYMTPLVALGLLAAFLLVASETYLATHVLKTFRLSFLIFGPTELRIVLAIGTLYLLHKPWVKIGSLGPYLLFDVGGLVAIVGLLITLLVTAIRNTRALYYAEKL
jgi:archaetidylinositol phosphate synthase